MSSNTYRAYSSSKGVARLCQGEILSNIVERPVKWHRRTEDGDEFGYDEIVHPYAVVLTQDCDLEQDARARENKALNDPKRRNALIDSVLLVIASEFDKAKEMFAGSDVRKRAKQNKDERFQFLSAVPVLQDAIGDGIPPLVLDFKRFFTYPTEELLGSISRGEAHRRARLNMPYAEHLSSRFGYFIQRIGLPHDHHDLDAGANQLPDAQRMKPLLVE